MLVSWIALALGVGNAVWSVWSWLRTGPKVVVIADVGSSSALGAGDPLGRVIVYNSGRTAITLYEVGFLAPNGHTTVVFSNDPGGVPASTLEPTPERLEPHSRCAKPYRFPLPSLHHLAEQSDSLVVGLTPYARLGDRTRILGRWEDPDLAELLGPHYGDE